METKIVKLEFNLFVEVTYGATSEEIMEAASKKLAEIINEDGQGSAESLTENNLISINDSKE